MLDQHIEYYKLLKGQYDQLKFQLTVITNALKAQEKLIAALGGEIEEDDETNKVASTKATWKDHIIAAISNLGQPSTVRDISSYLEALLDSDPETIFKNVTLVTSRLAASGEIKFDKSGPRHKYYLKNE